MASKSIVQKIKETIIGPESEGPLQELFVDSLKDIYWAESALAKALKKMAKASTSDTLRNAFETHLTQTEGHVERLKSVFESIGEPAKKKKCEAMVGLVAEAEELIENTEDGTEVRDVALISAAQKVEHYEIASYGTLKALAGILGYSKAQALLAQTLEEEKDTDALLTDIAESYVNPAAKAETK